MRRFVLSVTVALALAAATGLVLPALAGASHGSACTIVGTGGPDRLVGTSGDDVICGLGGSDRIWGLGGSDILRGGPGNDWLYGGAGGDILYGDPGRDRLVGGAGGDELYGDVGADALIGGPGDDDLDGGPGRDRLVGGPGDDRLRGGGGADILDVSGGGRDTVEGRQANDTVIGGGDRVPPDPVVSGGPSWEAEAVAAACTVVGTSAGEWLFGTSGDDVICGLGGDDTLVGGGGDDILRGGPGDDVLFGEESDDTLIGGTGDDTLNGQAGNDRLSGGRGSDRLHGGPGGDSLHGGPGGDRLSGGEGSDTIQGLAGGDWLSGGPGADRLYGGEGDDVLYGGPGPDFIDGGPGADRIDRLQPEDRVEGNDGRDSEVRPPPGRSWSDPVGDQERGEPDITAVTVSDDGRTLTFRVETTDFESLDFLTQIDIGLDIDQNAATGSQNRNPRGIEYAVVLRGREDTAHLWRWDGAAWQPRSSSLTVRWLSEATVTLRLREIGNPRGFDFFVKAGLDDGGGGGYDDWTADYAPDSGTWNYQVGTGGAAPPPVFAPRNIHSRPSHAYSPGRVVVHYVTAGPDAPSLVDYDRDGTPDYVEKIAEAAELSLQRFAELGFRPPSPDHAGPDSRVDIYVKDIDGDSDWAGQAVPFHRGDGSYAIVEPNKADDDLARIVAHELFHLVQFAYVPRAMPCWIGEGTAEAAETIAYPAGDFRAPHQHTRAWLEQPWKPLTEAAYGRTLQASRFCYAARAWFQCLHEQDPGLLPAYFDRLSEKLADSDPSDRELGIDPGAEILDTVTRTRGLGRVGSLYTQFAAAIYLHGHTVHTWNTIHPGTPKATGYWTIGPLAAHYIPVKPLHGCTVGIRVEGQISAQLIINGRLATPVSTGTGEVTFVENACPNHTADVLLLISSEGGQTTRYRIVHASE